MELIKTNSTEHIVLIDERDLKELNRIIKKINNQILNDSDTSVNNNNVQIGDHNSITTNGNVAGDVFIGQNIKK